MKRTKKEPIVEVEIIENKQLTKELILDNHSLVMYDHNLIPKDQIRVESVVKNGKVARKVSRRTKKKITVK